MDVISTFMLIDFQLLLDLLCLLYFVYSTLFVIGFKLRLLQSKLLCKITSHGDLFEKVTYTNGFGESE